MTYWKRNNAVLLLASEELQVDLVLPKEQCGDLRMTAVCIPFTAKMSKLRSQMIALHGKNFVTGCCEARSCAQQCYPQTKLSSTQKGITTTRNSHAWSPQEENSHAITETHFQTRLSVNIWCGITGNQLNGPFELEGRLTGERYRHCLQGARDVAAARWRTRSFWWHCRVQSTVCRPLDRPRGPAAWPASSPDHTHMDCRAWGHMKSGAC
jgi:hypothetical protein